MQLQQEGDLCHPRRPQGSVDPALEGLQQLQGSDGAFPLRVGSCCHHLGEGRREGSLPPPEPQFLMAGREGRKELGTARPAVGSRWLHPGCCQPRERSEIPHRLRQAQARCLLHRGAGTGLNSAPGSPTSPGQRSSLPGPHYSPAAETTGPGEPVAGLQGGRKAA